MTENRAQRSKLRRIINRLLSRYYEVLCAQGKGAAERILTEALARFEQQTSAKP
jgi:hypothetical protein